MKNNKTIKVAAFDSGKQNPTGDLASFQDILEGMEQGIVVWSDEGVCTFVNRRYFTITGSRKTDLFAGQTWDAYMRLLIAQGLYSEEQVEDMWEGLTHGKVVAEERGTANGRTISLTIRPLCNGGTVASMTDITATKENGIALTAALQRAEEAEVHAQTALLFQKTRQAEIDKLSEFTDWLHSCESLSELYEIVNQAMQYIYLDSSGQLYIYSNSRDVLDGVCSWGNSDISQYIHAQDCWSLRRGRVFEFSEGMIQYDCNHVHISENLTTKHYFCLPLIAHGDTVGLLHIDLSSCVADDSDEELKLFNLAFATRCAEQISLAVANAQLRDELHEQSTRDPLTGIFNRRYFLDRCRSEIIRAKQQSEVFGIAIFDADKFKVFNDHYGHDAGDAVLCHIADFAQKFFVEDDIVARIGGEEFAILSRQRSSEELMVCLEEFRQQIASMEVQHYNKRLPAVSVSLGYAMFPKHGVHVSDLVKQADAAMYQSKDSGRNCVHEASESKDA